MKVLLFAILFSDGQMTCWQREPCPPASCQNSSSLECETRCGMESSDACNLCNQASLEDCMPMACENPSFVAYACY